MTRQTSEPIEHRSLQASSRQAREIVRMFQEDGDLSPEYQRGSHWGWEHQAALVRSWLMGLPVPSIIINDRLFGPWPNDLGGLPEGGYCYAVVDGKQRIETARAWFAGDLAVPASWFPADDIVHTEDTDDGPYVRYSGLTLSGQRYTSSRFMLPTVEARVATIQEEAELYLLVNGGGMPQTESDMANAARVAQSGTE